jgi:hypothetical protein
MSSDSRMDRAITLIALLFIVFFSLLSLYSFYNQILVHITAVTPQLITTSFAIIGSCVLVVINTLIQAQRYYKILPIKTSTKIKFAEETVRELYDKQKALRNSIEAINTNRIRYENILKKQLNLEDSKISADVIYDNVINKDGQQTTLVRRVSPINSSAKDEFSIKIKGIRNEYINLLREIGVNTVSDLSKQDPEDLYRKIFTWNDLQEMNIVRIPSRGMIKRWIRIAGKD